MRQKSQYIALPFYLRVLSTNLTCVEMFAQSNRTQSCTVFFTMVRMRGCMDLIIAVLSYFLLSDFLYIMWNWASITFWSTSLNLLSQRIACLSAVVVPFYPWFLFWYSFVFSFLLDQGDTDHIVLPNNRSHLSCLLYADDLVLMSQSDQGLENALSILSEYCAHWLSSLNPKKTKIMICKKKYRKLTLNKHCFHISRLNIRNCCCFGGIWVHLW